MSESANISCSHINAWQSSTEHALCKSLFDMLFLARNRTHLSTSNPFYFKAIIAQIAAFVKGSWDMLLIQIDLHLHKLLFFRLIYGQKE